MKQIAPYIHGAREKIRVLILIYPEFYKNNKRFTSVALLSLKGNRNSIHSEAYQVVREVARSYIDAIKEGMEEGVFREDINSYLIEKEVKSTIDLIKNRLEVNSRFDLFTQFKILGGKNG